MNLESWLMEYGLFALSFLLAMGIIGLPIPDEILIATVGVLVAKGKFHLIPTLLATYIGALIGITTSYVLGYICEFYIVEKLGYVFGLTPQRIKRCEQWFKDIGKWILFFGYFLLGIRHLTGFVAGLMKLNYFQFAIFAYSGLVVWVTSLFIIGYAFSESWHHQLHITLLIGVIIAILALVLIYGYFFYRKRLTKK